MGCRGGYWQSPGGEPLGRRREKMVDRLIEILVGFAIVMAIILVF